MTNPIARRASREPVWRGRATALAAAIAGTAASLGLLAACAARTGDATEPAPSPVWLEVDGRPVTQAALDDWIRDDLFEREIGSSSPAERYQLRRDAATRMIEALVIAQEAERRGLSPEALIEAELAARGPVTRADVEAFYQENRERIREGVTLDEAEPDIRRFLERRRPREVREALVAQADVRIVAQPPRVEIAAVGAARGPAEAPVTIVEFSDYQCPFCKRAEPTIARVLERYPEDVRFVYRHFPLERIHPQARGAARAALCAQAQGRFWELHARIFESPGTLSEDDLQRYADEVGLDRDAFQTCLADPATDDLVQRDLDDGEAAGVTGTPAFFVNGVFVSGAQPFETFEALIERELERLADADAS